LLGTERRLPCGGQAVAQFGQVRDLIGVRAAVVISEPGKSLSVALAQGLHRGRRVLPSAPMLQPHEIIARLNPELSADLFLLPARQ
jgi:hypothetical protein